MNCSGVSQIVVLPLETATDALLDGTHTARALGPNAPLAYGTGRSPDAGSHDAARDLSDMRFAP